MELELLLDSELPLTIQSDPTRLRQILINLIGNAIKFTEAGSVTLRVCLDQRQETLRFDVIDTGIGMTTEQCDVIRKFEAFSQVDSSMQRQFGGTGLGLRISNSLAKMLGGQIHVESTPQVGSSFSFAISTGDLSDVTMSRPNDGVARHPDNVAKPHRQAIENPANEHLRALRVLLAEDGPDNQRLISFYLRKAGAIVTIADNGRVAAELIESGEGDFDVILMDMQIPELDGYETTMRLRKGGHSLPIIAMTAHAMSGDRQKCLDAGCDDYATKPIDRESLIQVVEHYGRKKLVPYPTFVIDTQDSLTTEPIS